MTDFLDIAIALLTVGLGAFGFLAPRYTADVLDLKTTQSSMGLSELRASAGGLFIALGATCLWLNSDWAYAMLGVAYAGAAAGRLLSIILDKPPMPKALVWFLFEALPALWLIRHLPQSMT